MNSATCLGPVMIDLAGPTLRADERERLAHPLVGGVILFARNLESPRQVRNLVDQLHALRSPPLLVAVDQEGGRVQRLRDGFTTLPSMRAVGRAYDRNAADGLHLAETVGTVLAGELAWLGIDFSFAPVLDLDYRRSEIIGDRALHSDPVIVAALGRALLRGFARYGRMGIGKHFPGHGYVVADSHLELPVDARAYAELESRDLLPYRELIDVLGGVMPAHVVYSEVAPVTAGFSSYWLTAILRQRLGFDGAIFSDDLAMAGAAAAGDIAARSAAALAAGCDMILICNDPSAAQSAITGLAEAGCAAAPNPRLERLRPGLVRSGWVNMADDPVLQTARCDLAASVA